MTLEMHRCPNTFVPTDFDQVHKIQCFEMLYHFFCNFFLQIYKGFMLYFGQLKACRSHEKVDAKDFRLYELIYWKMELTKIRVKFITQYNLFFGKSKSLRSLLHWSVVDD